MGMGNGAGCGLDVLGSKETPSSSSSPPPAASPGGFDGESVGLGLKLQSMESFACVHDNDNVMMTMGRHRDHRHRDGDDDDGAGAGGGGGVAAAAAGLRPGCMVDSNIYREDVAIAGCGGSFVRTLQPFDVSSCNNNISNTAFKSPGGMMAASLGFPFTSAQWKELERQAMIYKYMMAAVPVPPDLLFPIGSNLSVDPSVTRSPFGGGSLFSTRLTGNKDLEPGRCKRTDGKKWRCSRDVAPNQKYCERHMHRGRPRSRKPVEVHPSPHNTNNSSTSSASASATATTTATATAKKGRLDHNHNLLDSSVQPKVTPLFKDPNANRGLEMEIGGEMITAAVETSESQWQHLMETNIGLTTGTSVFQQDYSFEPLNMVSYSDFAGRGEESHHQHHRHHSQQQQQTSGECNLFLNPNMVCLDKQHTAMPRGFIDAWSSDKKSIKSKDSSAAAKNLSPSSLTLSMAMAAAGNNATNGEIDLIYKDSDRAHDLSSWAGAVPWATTPGGPLAEVLRPSSFMVGADNHPASPCGRQGGGAGDSISPPVTTVSSPSGVLHRTMLSLSDGSVCNSPTIAASTATPENVAFHWLS